MVGVMVIAAIEVPTAAPSVKSLIRIESCTRDTAFGALRGARDLVVWVRFWTNMAF